MFMSILYAQDPTRKRRHYKYKRGSTNTINSHEKRKRGRTENTDWGQEGLETGSFHSC